ncbi:MAG: nucleoside deaminase [Prevotella sp.]|nr:nucleoside deaminase [Prevotella sp.]MCM1074810.1 nucleoside deaminase [Ruminococcus sp.]
MLFETQEQTDERFMRIALQEAQEASEIGEIPVGAVIVQDGQLIARAHNLTEKLQDVTAHAEMQAITSAAMTLGGKYLQGCTLYVTVEPCPMCAGAIGWAQISRIVYGAADPKRGYSTLTPSVGAKSPLHPKATVTPGVLEDYARELMQNFFRQKR